MKNACRINHDGTVSILLNLKAGGNLEAVVSELDYESYAEPFSGAWAAYKHPRTGKYYARGNYRDPSTGEVSQPMLHRLIGNPYKGQITAHIDGNTLNCVRDNMINIPIGADIKEFIIEKPAVKKSDDVGDYLRALATTEAENLPDILEELKQAGLIDKGVSFHKHKRRWEVSAFHDGVRHRLGYWPTEELYTANDAVNFFRLRGPEAFNARYRGGK